MANTAALLGNLLSINADINYYTQQSIYWNMMYEGNSAKLQEQVKYEEKWEKAYDEAIGNDKEKKCGCITVAVDNQNTSIADAYAHKKVAQYNEELSQELADLDIEYDTMRQMYDTLLEELRANKDAAKTVTSTAAQDTGLLQGG